MFRRLTLALLLLGGVVCLGMGGFGLHAEEALPPAPNAYVTDQAGVISPQVVAELNRQLSEFEKTTSNQIIAVVYQKLPEGVEVGEYAQNLYHTWKIGQKKTSNGALVLVFVQNKKAWIQTGYGLEGALPDVLCTRIIRETMSPLIRAGNYTAGLRSGLTAVMQAIKGEYKGTGKKAHHTTLLDLLFSPLGFFLLVMLIIVIINRVGGGSSGGGNGLGAAATGFFIGSRMGGGGWGSGGGSGGSDGGGGGFSGGGGDTGGGGGGGDW